jgi:hypothetical protein
MKKFLQTIVMSITLGLGVWSLAVTFAPVTSNFSAGQQVSATAFNDLFAAINSNFNEAKTAIEASESAIVASNLTLEALVSPPAASVGRTASQAVANNTSTTVAFTAESFDSADLHDNATNNTRLTTPVEGLYQVSANVKWGGVNPNGSRSLNVLKNGVTELEDARSAFDGVLSQSVSGLLSMSAGDFVEVQVFQDSGAALSILAPPGLAFSMVKVGELP